MTSSSSSSSSSSRLLNPTFNKGLGFENDDYDGDDDDDDDGDDDDGDDDDAHVKWILARQATSFRLVDC